MSRLLCQLSYTAVAGWNPAVLNDMGDRFVPATRRRLSEPLYGIEP